MWSNVGGCLDRAHLVPDVTMAFLVEFDDVHNGLRILLLFRSGDTAFLKKLLPLLREAGELSCRRVEADMGEMDRIVRGADLWPLGGI